MADTAPALRRAPAPGGSRSRFGAVLVALGAVLAISMVIGISVGTVNLPVSQVWAVVGRHLGLVGGTADPIDDQIIWTFRTPRVLLAAVVGAGLSVAGVCLQSLARNGLADPYVLGVSSGASLGAVLAVALGVPVLADLGVTGAAFAAATLTLLVVMVLAQQAGQLGSARLVLAGVAVSYLATAGTSFVQLYVNPLELRGIMFWLMGSLASSSWGDLGLPTAAIVLSGAWLLGRARSLNVLATGDDNASALGVPVNRFRLELLVVSSLLTASTVAVAGGIGFVGLMVPHAARFVVGPDHRRVLPVSVLGGAVFLVVVDILCRVADRPNELPVGVFTAAFGAPFFLVLLRRAGRGLG